MIINDVLKEGRDTDAWSYPKLLSILLNLGSNTEGHNKQLLKTMKKDVEWIDFLYYSPLGRVGRLAPSSIILILDLDTHMDVIIRRIGVYVQTAYADKSSSDLILGEEAESQRNTRNKPTKTLRKKVPSQPSKVLNISPVIS